MVIPNFTQIWDILSLSNRFPNAMPNLDDLYRIDQFNDTFALGHYARVLDALDRRTGLTVAFKVLRPEHLDPLGDIRWEYRAFANEADLLSKLSGSPHVVKLMDCGYIEARGEAPSGGQIDSFQMDIMGFIRALPEYAERGWRPYLAEQNLPRILNLLYLMKPNQPGVRWRLPSEEGLALALQFGELLKTAHSKGIVYMDHKLEHVYWDGTTLRIIDLNSSRQLEGATGDEQYYRMDIHNLCVGILYPLFTGLSPQKAALRPQPGPIHEAEGRYQDILELDFGVEPSLSYALQALLQDGASMRLETAEQFSAGLHQVGALHGWDFPDQYTSPASRDARAQLRAGLTRLRKGQAELREARDLFREAAIQDGITEDLEAELRRLVKSVTEMLNGRVIP
jgi:serine/threonine protein kinase